MAYHFSLMHMLWVERFWDDPLALCGISIIFEEAVHRFSNWIRAQQYNYLTDILDLVYLWFAKMFKEWI